MTALRTRRFLSIALTLLLVVGTVSSALAQNGSARVVRSFAPPGASSYGLDYVEDQAGNGTLYHTDWYTGNVYTITTSGVATLIFNVPEAIGVPYLQYSAAGICYVGSGDDQRSGTLYILEPDRGSAPYYTYVRSFTTDGTHLNTYDVSEHTNRAWAITYDGNHFWLVGYGTLTEFDSNFNLVQEHVVPWGVGTGGLDYDPSTDRMYNASSNYNVFSVFERGASAVDYYWLVPDWGHYYVQLALGHVSREARTFWVMDNTAVLIMELHDEYYDPVETTTWGSIKALYR
jgi:hypothetical protein